MKPVILEIIWVIGLGEMGRTLTPVSDNPGHEILLFTTGIFSKANDKGILSLKIKLILNENIKIVLLHFWQKSPYSIQLK